MINTPLRIVFALSLVIGLASTTREAAAITKLLETIHKEFFAPPSIEDLPRLRRSAAKGDAEAQFLMYHAYRTQERRGLPPWEKQERLVSREEAEKGLRAAAEKGHIGARRALATDLLFGNSIKQDPRAALIWLGKLEAAGDAAELDYLKALALDRVTDRSEDERQRTIELADKAIAGGQQIAIGPKARAIAAKDPAAARKMLEDSLAANPHAALPLARMMIAGIGGPADPKRAKELLQNPKSAEARAELGRQHLGRGVMPRMPRKGIDLMAEYAENDPATRQELAKLLIPYRVKLQNDKILHLRMQEDADLGVPDAAYNVLNLHRIHREGFRSEKVWFALIPRYANSDPRIALFNVGRLARFTLFSKDVAKTRFEKQVRDLIADLEAKSVPGVFAVHADLMQRGIVFPQDSEGAVALLERGAELGDPTAMIALADALDSGKGVAKDRKRSIELLRQAASAGSFEARGKLASQFRFLSRDNGVTLADGITNRIAMYGDGMGNLGAMMMGSFFAGSQMSGLKPGEILAPFYDGFRISPAAAEDRLLVPLIKQTPDWIWKATETILVHYKYWDGQPNGYMGPEARDAFRRFIAESGSYSYK